MCDYQTEAKIQKKGAKEKPGKLFLSVRCRDSKRKKTFLGEIIKKCDFNRHQGSARRKSIFTSFVTNLEVVKGVLQRRRLNVIAVVAAIMRIESIPYVFLGRR